MRAEVVRSRDGPQPAAGGAVRWEDFTEVLHPYFGYVPDPDANSAPISDQGFFSPDGEPAFQTRAEDRAIVGIFGGSFAAQLYLEAGEHLEACLAETGRTPVLLAFAAGGYKQPQQVMILSYLLTLGAEFDLVLNIDGFNEVSLPYGDNLPNGVNPFYPRMWHLRVANVVDPRFVQAVGRVAHLREERSHTTRNAYELKLYRSPAASLAWRLRDRQLERRIHEEQELRRV